MMKHDWKLIAVCGVVFSMWANPAPAQGTEKLSLRVADSLPTGKHWLVDNGIKPWMAAVTRTTGGAITFEYYPSEQLGKTKDMLALALSGVTDIAYVVPSFISDNKMPLSGVAELPGSFVTSCQGTLAYSKLAKDGILAEKDFAPNGIRLLFTAVMPPYQFITSKKKIESLKDVEGLKLRTAGAALDLTARKLKAVPVRLSTPDIYDALSRGTIDGIIFPFSSLAPYKLDSLVKYATIDESLGAVVVNFVISEARWKKLPENVQKAMMDAGEETTRRLCTALDQDLQTDIAKLKQGGLVTVQLPASDKKELQGLLAGVQTEWAEALDKRGKPGTEVFKAFRAAVQQSR